MKLRTTCSLIFGLLLASSLLGQAPGEAQSPQLDPVTPYVSIYHKPTNVAVIQRNGKSLLIGSGDGTVLTAAKKLGTSSMTLGKLWKL